MDHIPSEVLDFETYRTARQQSVRDVISLESLISKNDFKLKSANLNVNGLILRAQANTPFKAERLKTPVVNLWLHRSGYVETQAKNLAVRYGANESAFLSALDHEYFITSHQSAVKISLDEGQLNRTLSSMLGRKGKPISLENSRAIPFQQNRFSFFSIFANLFRQVDEVNGDESVLKLLQFDESIRRLCVTFLSADQIFDDRDIARKLNSCRKELITLCEHLSASLTKPISLTEMEEISGLSARVLQYSFQKAFGLRPKEWLRKQRLHAARALLKKSDQQIKLTSLAYDYCFPSPSNFATHYYAEFGELPSQTIAAKRVM